MLDRFIYSFEKERARDKGEFLSYTKLSHKTLVNKLLTAQSEY